MKNLINTSIVMKNIKLYTVTGWRFRGHIACYSYVTQS